jgi:hypothetical protein
VKRAALLCLLLVLPLAGEAKIHRDPRARHEFKQLNPCPSTGRARGACAGWIIDHRVALCVGGRDAPENMQWMTVADAKAKDRWECRPGWQERLEQESLL